MNSKSPSIEVLVVEDHPLAQAGLRNFLAAFPELSLMEVVDSGEKAIRFCEEREPDVILMDLGVPDMDSLALIREIKRHRPTARIVVLTYLEESAIIDEALQAGATSYVLKTSSATELAYSVRAAKQGHSGLLEWSEGAEFTDYGCA